MDITGLISSLSSIGTLIGIIIGIIKLFGFIKQQAYNEGKEDAIIERIKEDLNNLGRKIGHVENENRDHAKDFSGLSLEVREIKTKVEGLEK